MAVGGGGGGAWSKHNHIVIYHQHDRGLPSLQNRELKCLKPKFPKRHKPMRNASVKSLIYDPCQQKEDKMPPTSCSHKILFHFAGDLTGPMLLIY